MDMSPTTFFPMAGDTYRAGREADPAAYDAVREAVHRRYHRTSRRNPAAALRDAHRNFFPEVYPDEPTPASPAEGQPTTFPETFVPGDYVRHADSSDTPDQIGIVAAISPSGGLTVIAPGPEGIGVETIENVSTGDMRRTASSPTVEVSDAFVGYTLEDVPGEAENRPRDPDWRDEMYVHTRAQLQQNSAAVDQFVAGDPTALWMVDPDPSESFLDPSDWIVPVAVDGEYRARVYRGTRGTFVDVMGPFTGPSAVPRLQGAIDAFAEVRNVRSSSGFPGSNSMEQQLNAAGLDNSPPLLRTAHHEALERTPGGRTEDGDWPDPMGMDRSQLQELRNQVTMVSEHPENRPSDDYVLVLAEALDDASLANTGLIESYALSSEFDARRQMPDGGTRSDVPPAPRFLPSEVQVGDRVMRARGREPEEWGTVRRVDGPWAGPNSGGGMIEIDWDNPTLSTRRDFNFNTLASRFVRSAERTGAMRVYPADQAPESTPEAPEAPPSEPELPSEDEAERDLSGTRLHQWQLIRTRERADRGEAPRALPRRLAEDLVAAADASLPEGQTSGLTVDEPASGRHARILNPTGQTVAFVHPYAVRNMAHRLAFRMGTDNVLDRIGSVDRRVHPRGWAPGSHRILQTTADVRDVGRAITIASRQTIRRPSSPQRSTGSGVQPDGRVAGMAISGRRVIQGDGTLENRTVGVENEFNGIDGHRMVELLRGNGWPASRYRPGYGGGGPHEWATSHDSTAGRESIEVGTATLRGEEGLQRIRDTFSLYRDNGGRAGSQAHAGLHVHIGANDFMRENVNNVLLSYGRNRQLIEQLVSNGRRGTTWARPGFGGGHGTEINEMTEHSTIEFRRLGSTMDPDLAADWADMMRRMVQASKDNPLQAFGNLAQMLEALGMSQSQIDRLVARAAEVRARDAYDPRVIRQQTHHFFDTLHSYGVAEGEERPSNQEL
jgi:hypothetical protein